ncbi:MAG TPA: metallophosphoesterase [Lacipirellula sp.]
MRIGIFADTHDHLANIARAVERFNDERVEAVLFAGDLVSTIAVPPLRKLHAPFVGCYGDNEGNKIGLQSGMRLVGTLAEPPVRWTAADGTRVVLAHMKRQLRGVEDYDVAVFGHTHKPRVERDDCGRLHINPGETSGWTYGRPTIAILDTETREVVILDLLPEGSFGAEAGGAGRLHVGRGSACGEGRI